jgi:hypothetical protein
MRWFLRAASAALETVTHRFLPVTTSEAKRHSQQKNIAPRAAKRRAATQSADN